MVIVLRILSFNTCMYLPDTWLLLQGARGNCLLKKPYCQQVLTRPRLLLQMKGHGCKHPQHCHSAPSHKWIFEFASHHCRLHVGPQSNKFAISRWYLFQVSPACLARLCPHCRTTQPLPTHAQSADLFRRRRPFIMYICIIKLLVLTYIISQHWLRCTTSHAWQKTT